MSDSGVGWGFNWGNNWGGGWTVDEDKVLKKKLAKKKGGLPEAVRYEYGVWKTTIWDGGIEAIDKDNSYNHEPLKGKMAGLFSSRLSKKYRVIYTVDEQKRKVFVENVDTHDKAYF